MTPSTYEVQIVVTLQADMDEPHAKSAVVSAAVQAIEDAVRSGDDNGLSHDLADDVSFGLVAVEPMSRKKRRPPKRDRRLRGSGHGQP